MDFGNFGRYAQSACYNYIDLNHTQMNGKPIFGPNVAGAPGKNTRSSLHNTNGLPSLKTRLMALSNRGDAMSGTNNIDLSDVDAASPTPEMIETKMGSPLNELVLPGTGQKLGSPLPIEMHDYPA
mmetsp:Transcript_28091/g.34818  ORF Transcript_28091/g.34818 Transcript_28091/m.34818 type:complete len:125 (+) Transcript_28091:212-586(+)